MLFRSSYSVFSFLCREKSLFYGPLYRARQGPLYSACRDQCFTVLPLNRLCLVWACLPIVQNPCQTEANPFCLLCAPRTHFVSACRDLSCRDIYFLSPHTQSMHSTVPSQIASFGWSIIPAGRTSQKRLEQGPKIDPFPSPHHQTTPPLPLTSGPWPYHVLYWLGTGWWRLGLARASPLILSKRLPAAHVSAVTWRLSFCVFWPFIWAFFWSFASIRNWALYDDGLYISRAYHFVFLCCLPCWLIVPAVMTQSCWAPFFWAGRFIPFLSGLP